MNVPQSDKKYTKNAFLQPKNLRIDNNEIFWHNMKYTSYYGGGKLKNRVKQLRIEKGITQQQLASLVHVSARTIISLEKEQYNPSLMLAYRIALVFGTTVEELYCLKENKKEEDAHYEILTKHVTDQ